MDTARRNLLIGVGGLSVALILRDGFTPKMLFAGESNSQKESENNMEMEVTAVEDLMREHGVLRRLLIVYSESVGKFRQSPTAAIYEPVNKAAQLFRTFGENYHEKALEETFIFPAVAKAGGEASGYINILIDQHRRGREITDYILAATKGKDSVNVKGLTSAMEAFVRMYRSHAAREDTVVFPAWKQTINQEQLEEMGEKFEEIEHEQFGEDGFDKAVSQVAEIEKQLGLSDLSQFTAPAVVI